MVEWPFGFTTYGVALIGTYVFFTVVVLVVMCADPEGKGVLAALARFSTEDAPRAFSKLLRALCGARVASTVEGGLWSCFDWTCNKRNPLLQTFYLVVILGAYGLVVKFAYPMVPAYYLPAWHRYVAVVAGSKESMIMSYVFIV